MAAMNNREKHIRRHSMYTSIVSSSKSRQRSVINRTNHRAQIFLSSCVRHGCNPPERFPGFSNCGLTKIIFF